MVDVVVYLDTDEKVAQQKLGWIGGKTALYLQNAEKIAQATEGKVYIKEPRYSHEPTLDSESEYRKLKYKVEELLIEAGARALQEGRIAENVRYSRGGMVQKVPAIDVSELYDELRKTYEEYRRELEEKEKREKRLREQWEAFRNSEAYKLYTDNRYWDNLGELGYYLNDDNKKRYKELYNMLKNEVLTDEELKKVIAELEEMYREARVSKCEHEVKKLQRENSELINKIVELHEHLDTLREFIAEKHDAEELIEWLRERDEEEEDQYREEAEELVPQLFEDEDDEDDC